MITTHCIYNALGDDAAKRQSTYRSLFEHHVPERTIEEIRAATNIAWVLGNDRFQERIEKLSRRQVKPKPRGGDRRSEKFEEQYIARVFCYFVTLRARFKG